MQFVRQLCLTYPCGCCFAGLTDNTNERFDHFARQLAEEIKQYAQTVRRNAAVSTTAAQREQVCGVHHLMCVYVQC